MLIMGFLELCTFILDILFKALPDVPQFDIAILESLNGFVNLIFDNLGLLGFFIDIDMIKFLLPLLIIAINFEHIYHFVFWVIEKIPILNIRK